jgi:predicted MPP superfamily phosphohydrolase
MNPPRLTRRKLLRRLGQGGLLTALSGVGGYGYARAVEPGWLEVVRQRLVLPRLPAAFAGFTIAQLSDLHLGPYLAAEHLAPTVRAVMDLEPDAIVLTGDYVSRLDHGEADMLEQVLAPLRAPQGVFAVLGNHDCGEGAAEVSRALRRAGVTVLHNEHVSWRRDGQTLYLAGVGDVWCGQHDLDRALAGLSTASVAVLLAHEPDYADEVAQDRRVVLQLSGHSHGGQVRVPGYGGLHFPPWARKYSIGLRQLGELTLYTNRGIGMVVMPIRFCCRPELTLFTLESPLASSQR